ncbi:hypothetical protein PRtIB026_A38840 [Pseudomonas sp. RtIB026]|uniref:T6SS effector BTH_I2691 family protein n=1 Tax=Pseudomonas sp. RtIB026 TaxID=2749999 RepID=UPI00194077B4|nr:T6SS effector BTH_I2691 family protein [Pseudomonas sp. RtIB026]BCJ06344.1 hypothetical protein PRtIB026_A38840 [Pseudomonas sp. RtIB026]
MTLSLSQSILDAQRQAIPVPKPRCSACQRIGLPILLLRTAYAPSPKTLSTRNLPNYNGVAGIPMHSEQLRILRQGYVYVLLDQRVWHAYQVTPEGALRQFPAFQPPPQAGKPLSTACRQEHHDVIASFININTLLYSTAWIAFANDPWPKPVLDQYKHAIANNDPELTSRFLALDLKAAREAPGSVGRAMHADRLQLDEVLEYAVPSTGPFTSVHGFYPRLERLAATRTYIAALIQREELADGVLALTVPDPVGMVQECNAQRLAWAQALQAWRAEPQRHFEHFTSLALLGIRELNATLAAGEAATEVEREAREVERWNSSPLLAAKAPLPAVDVEAQLPRRIERKQQEARERFEERYDEGARSAFARAYETELHNRQQLIDQLATLYAELYAAPAFQRIAYNDYSAIDWRSAEYFVGMMSSCLYGGPSETQPQDGAALGASQRLWQQELENPDSLLYQALVAKHQGLLRQLLEALTSQDLSKVYDTIKGLTTSYEGQQLMVKPVRDAIGQLLAATANAGNTLHQHLSAGARQMIGYVHSAALLRFAGQHMTQLVVPLRAGEYLKLLNEGLQARTDALLGQLDQAFRKPAAHKVNAMLLSGAITAAVSGKHGKVVELVLWTMESAEDLQARLQHLQASAGTGAGEALRSVRIGADSLQYQAAHSLRLLSLSAEQTRALAREAMGNLRSGLSGLGPGRADLMLSLGGLWFQQDSLRRNHDALNATPGNAEAEALAAVWSSSIGVLGLSIEATGKAIEILRPARVGVTAGSTLMQGTQLVRYGGAIAAVAGIADGTNYLLAAQRTASQGDSSSRTSYYIAGALSLSSAFVGMSTLVLGTAFLGPVGIALVLALSAYTFATIAKKSESSPLEIWARQSRWGLPASHREWQVAEDNDNAIGALNAALLGITAHASIDITFKETHPPKTIEPFVTLRDSFSVPLETRLNYTITIPNFTHGQARYEWTLVIYSPGRNTVPTVYSGDSDKAKNELHESTGTPEDSSLRGKPLRIEGSTPTADFKTIDAFELTVCYWPDKDDSTNLARLVKKQDKLDVRN